VSWRQLNEIWEENVTERGVVLENQCPRDGEVLMVGEDGEKRCKMCGWPFELSAS